MHVINSNRETTHLWLNSKHEKSDNKPQILLENASAESIVAEVTTLTKDTNFSYHDVIKVVRRQVNKTDRQEKLVKRMNLMN